MRRNGSITVNTTEINLHTGQVSYLIIYECTPLVRQQQHVLSHTSGLRQWFKKDISSGLELLRIYWPLSHMENLFFFFWLLFFESGCHYVAQVCLILMMPLPEPPKCWDCRHGQPC
jgi:hypothetical protein